MAGTSLSGNSPSAQRQRDSSRAPLFWGTGLLGAVLLGALLTLKATRQSPAPAAPPTPQPNAQSHLPAPAQTQPALNPSAAPVPVAAPALAPTPMPLSARSAQQLMADLAALSSSEAPLTKEQAQQFALTLAELVRQGSNSVPGIREFLQKNLETDYSELSGGAQLGYSSLRASLIETLAQIGGPEAQSTMLEVLQTSAVPAELLELAKNLDLQAPGQYREQILNAARQALEMASANQLGTNMELGPAFRIVQNYGEANTAEQVAKEQPANFASALALANLPDAQGLPSLLAMAEDSNAEVSSKGLATEVIAQLAGQSSQAFNSLLSMAQRGQIAENLWMRLAPILGGDQYQLGSADGGSAGSAGPSFSIVNQATTAEQINQRITLIDRCLATVPADSSGAFALRQARDGLLAKLHP